ncbi:hypothetical protein AB0323_10490 [Arthrobacter sp. NPDC080031]|uniref:hypothetical protein n=1 Tax=Arthrobacter sp. NPDC080031 TaxID=3155918 RepID=UPI00344C401B
MKKEILAVAGAMLVLTGCSTPATTATPAAANVASTTPPSSGPTPGTAALTLLETCMAVNKALNPPAGETDTPGYWASVRDQLRPLGEDQKTAPLLKADIQGAIVYTTIRANTWAPKDIWQKNPANQGVADLGTRSINNLDSKCPGGRNRNP